MRPFHGKEVILVRTSALLCLADVYAGTASVSHKGTQQQLPLTGWEGGETPPCPGLLTAHGAHGSGEALAEALTQGVTGLVLPGAYVQAGE